MTEGYDVYPILHEGKFYNLITEIDFSFPQARALISELESRGAFSETGRESEVLGPGSLYSLPIEDFLYEVDVNGYEIVVYKREQL